MRSPTSHGLICRGMVVAGTPAIAAPGASYAVDLPRLLENDELLPPSVADSPTGKIDEHREDESSELRRQAVHGSGAAPLAVRRPVSGRSDYAKLTLTAQNTKRHRIKARLMRAN